MKQTIVVLLSLFTVFGHFKCYGHGKDDHVKQMKQVFNGYDSDVEDSNDGRKQYGVEEWENYSFYRYYERFTFELDVYKRIDKNTLCSQMRQALKKEFGCDVLHGGHRAYGHMWKMGENIKKQTVAILEDKHQGATAVIDKVWKDFCGRHYKKASKLLGLSENDKAVKAFSSIVHCVHLIGDREPGNTRVDLVLQMKYLIKEVSEQAGKLFDAKFEREVEENLFKAYNNTSGDDKKKAKAVLNKMIELGFGRRLHDKYGDKIKCRWSSSKDSVAP